MRTLFIIALFLPNFSFSRDLGNGNFDGEVEMNSCYKNGEQFMYEITGKLKKNEYEIKSNFMIPKYRLAILKTKVEFNDTTRIGGPMKITGSVKIRLTNGFEKTAFIWEPCETDGPSKSKPGKDASCQDTCFKKKKFPPGESIESCLREACK